MGSVTVFSTNKIQNLIPTWLTLANKPTYIAAGETAAEAREAIGISEAASLELATEAEAIAGALTTKAVSPAGTKAAILNFAQPINAQTGTSYTLLASDIGKLITCTNAGAITFTLPSDASVSWPVGAAADVVPLGAGMITFVAGSGVNPLIVADTAVTRKTGSGVTIKKVAANKWWLVGDFEQ